MRIIHVRIFVKIALCKAGKILESAVQRATLVLSNDNNIAVFGADVKAVFFEIFRFVEIAIGFGVSVDRTDDDRRGAGVPVLFKLTLSCFPKMPLIPCCSS
jgi:hypothetical protein